MKGVLIAASLYATAAGLSVSQSLVDIINPELYSVDEEGDCLNHLGNKVTNQHTCCNVDPSSEERVELFKEFCINTVEDEVCAKFVYHIETERCHRAAVDRTKYYQEEEFTTIVGEPLYTSSFDLFEKGHCCLQVDDFDDNIEACEDPEVTETIVYTYSEDGDTPTCTKETTTITGRKVAIIRGEE